MSMSDREALDRIEDAVLLFDQGNIEIDQVVKEVRAALRFAGRDA